MPELPEVECFARTLKSQFSGKRIESVEFFRNDIRFPLQKTKIKNILEKTELTNSTRHGKSLILETSKGKILVGLGMSGRFQKESGDHEHIRLTFSDYSVLRYLDARRFGFWKAPSHAEWKKLLSVPDGLNSSLVFKSLVEQKNKKSQRTIKTVLLDQSIVGGVGNIYAVEALFAAGISPLRKMSDCQEQELQNISLQLKRIFETAITFGGSSISSYRTLHGNQGQFQNLHKIYQREGEPCLAKTKKCNGVVVKLVQTGRSTYYCPKCQK